MDEISSSGPVEVVAKSPSGMVDAVRQALAGAVAALGTLERCDATLVPRVVHDGDGKQFQIMLSVTRR